MPSCLFVGVDMCRCFCDPPHYPVSFSSSSAPFLILEAGVWSLTEQKSIGSIHDLGSFSSQAYIYIYNIFGLPAMDKFGASQQRPFKRVLCWHGLRWRHWWAGPDLRPAGRVSQLSSRLAILSMISVLCTQITSRFGYESDWGVQMMR